MNIQYNSSSHRMKLLLILISAIAVATDSEESPQQKSLWGDSYLTVKTENGYVKGYLGKSCRSGREFAGFRGIPYAEPPLGELRFRDPVPRGNWQGVWNATIERSACVQTDLGDEDCLYMNVYTPNLMHLRFGLSPLKAVMVFIHPGAFNTGSNSESVYSPDFLIDHDVIVVTFNYRLGALGKAECSGKKNGEAIGGKCNAKSVAGFLSLQNEEVPGNAGLKDQTLALRWVKKNIRSFGGNPEKITIFGESAGSASVNYHLISDSSAGLFRSAIMQSGSVLASWAYSPPELALKKAINLSHRVWCFQKDPAELLKCLQKVPATTIQKHQEKALTLEELFTLRIISFQPTSEPDHPNAFLTDNPWDRLSSGNFTKVPTVIGLTSNEGLLVYPALMKYDPHGLLLTLLGMDLSRFAPYDFHLKPFTKPAIRTHRAISKFYFDSKTVSKAEMSNALELLTDVMFTVPIQLTASLFARASVPVYNYLFTYDGGYNLVKAATDIMNVTGVCHGDDLGYLFYTPRLHTKCRPNHSVLSPDEITLSRMTKMWTDFAKTGNPTPKTDSEIPHKWEQFTQTERKYLDIGSELVPSESLKRDNMLFWENLIGELIEMSASRSWEEEFDDLEMPEMHKMFF